MKNLEPIFAIENRQKVTFWIDADQSSDEIAEEIEGFGCDSKNFKVLEYQDLPDLGSFPSLQMLSEMGTAVGEPGEAFLAYCELQGYWAVSTEEFKNSYFGIFQSERKMAEEFMDRLGGNESVNEEMLPFIDWRKYAQHLLKEIIHRQEYNGTEYYFWRA